MSSDIKLCRSAPFDINQLHLVVALSLHRPRLMVLGAGNETPPPRRCYLLQALFEPTISTHDSRLSHDFSST